MMKTSALNAFVLMIFVACSGNVNDKVAGDSIANDTNQDTKAISSAPICFQRLEGTSNQDTAIVRLVINGSKVTGDFNHIPHEKDSSKGSIIGNRKGDIITAVWSFMQEGMNDTMRVEFKLENDRLLQKTLSVDPKTGRQFTSDTSQHTLEYIKIECRK